jgi:hypothetical protein
VSSILFSKVWAICSTTPFKNNPFTLSSSKFFSSFLSECCFHWSSTFCHVQLYAFESWHEESLITQNDASVKGTKSFHGDDMFSMAIVILVTLLLVSFLLSQLFACTSCQLICKFVL